MEIFIDILMQISLSLSLSLFISLSLSPLSHTHTIIHTHKPLWLYQQSLSLSLSITVVALQASYHRNEIFPKVPLCRQFSLNIDLMGKMKKNENDDGYDIFITTRAQNSFEPFQLLLRNKIWKGAH